LVANHVLQLAQAGVDGLRVAASPLVEVGGADDTGDARLRGPAPRVAGERDGARRAAVVRAIAHEDLVAAGHYPRHPDGVLVGLGPAVGEEERVDVAGRDLGQLLAQARPRL